MTKKEKKAPSPKVARAIVVAVIVVTIIHTIYMNLMGFNSLSHDACLVYKSVPVWFFYLYENVLELFIVVILGVFAGVLTEQYFNRIAPFYPKNQVLAFLYGAILPVCSCGVLPMIESMKKHTSLRVIITFVIAAPLLNPYIIFVSFTVLGVKYMVLRIVSSFVLAVLTGLLVDFVSHRFASLRLGTYDNCAKECGPVTDDDAFVKTVAMTKRLVPYILFAAALSFTFQIVNPKQFLDSLSFYHEPYSMFILTVIGIPLYVCNGADVLFLKPLMSFTDLTMGSAMAFSLSASALCLASIVMLTKFLGKGLTTVLVGTVFVLTITIGMLINLIV